MDQVLEDMKLADMKIVTFYSRNISNNEMNTKPQTKITDKDNNKTIVKNTAQLKTKAILML